ncbi:MmpS family transport accessory protein [Nocardia cyriacigeorgica]|uniref:Mycobacterium membrane protein n=1 Tax=Nocardia cyriacigeorgica TaxID=135487 RepID=A0A4U8VXC4_9NOCA|nr:MmpS family transport accessory protein [Nocardia cyriacigeorgica]VFA96604.1 Mycobacterium membrane protein [Nocardia cyriacigeorgica]
MTNPPGDQPQYPSGPHGYPQGQYPPPGMPPPGYYQPPKKRRIWPWIVGGIVLFFVLMIGGCLAFFGGVANEIDKESKREVTVTYRVEGTSSEASVTYSGRDMNMAQETSITLPWSKDVTIDGLGKFVSMTATNNADSGEITCRILVGEKVISEQTSSGPFASASCSGDAGQE